MAGSGKSRRGFASMDPSRQREIASKGGKAAHAKGTAHEWSSDEARVAGRRGGEVVSRDRAHMAAIGREGGEARGASARAARASRFGQEGRTSSNAERDSGSPRSAMTDREVSISGNRMGSMADRSGQGRTERSRESREEESRAGGSRSSSDREAGNVRLGDLEQPRGSDEAR